MNLVLLVQASTISLAWVSIRPWQITCLRLVSTFQASTIIINFWIWGCSLYTHNRTAQRSREYYRLTCCSYRLTCCPHRFTCCLYRFTCCPYRLTCCPCCLRMYGPDLLRLREPDLLRLPKPGLEVSIFCLVEMAPGHGEGAQTRLLGEGGFIVLD